MVWSLIYEQLLSIRDELFDTFRKRHKGVMEVEEVQLTASSLHRLNFLPFLVDSLPIILDGDLLVIQKEYCTSLIKLYCVCFGLSCNDAVDLIYNHVFHVFHLDSEDNAYIVSKLPASLIMTRTVKNT
jgi:hypothetical protein